MKLLTFMPKEIHRKNSNELFYFHLDLQGSLMAISNLAGAVVEERNYDAWGRPRNPATLAYTLPNPFGGATSNYTLRGYTFHEHLDMFDLINMNGRMYDTHLGIFLNADPLLQDPTNVQNYNRNSYVLNNPLKYTDPSGYASIGFATPTLGGGFNPGENEQTNSWNRWQDSKASMRRAMREGLDALTDKTGGFVGGFFMGLTSGTIIRNNNSAENFVSNYYSFRSMLNFNSSLYDLYNSLINSISSEKGGIIDNFDDFFAFMVYHARNTPLEVSALAYTDGKGLNEKYYVGPWSENTDHTADYSKLRSSAPCPKDNITKYFHTHPYSLQNRESEILWMQRAGPSREDVMISHGKFEKQFVIEPHALYEVYNFEKRECIPYGFGPWGKVILRY
jgi:RHS repeat-associated protein